MITTKEANLLFDLLYRYYQANSKMNIQVKSLLCILFLKKKVYSW